MSRLRNSRGVTLVEIVVYMLVSSIVLVAVGALFGSINGMFANSRTRNEAKLVGDAVYSLISEELRFATYLSCYGSSGDTAGSSDISINGGRVILDGQDVFGEEFYLGNTVEIETADINAFSLSLTVRVMDRDGEQRYETGSAIETINLKLLGAGGIMYSPDSDINPKISYTRGAKP